MIENVDDTEQEHTKYQKKGPTNWSLYAAFACESVSAVFLTATFNTFHVEVFLTEYKLSLHHYATGHVIYAVINTLNDILGAYFLDVLAHRYWGHGRAWLLQNGGFGWALVFLLPWFPWKNFPLLHFICSLSCYDTMYSFCAIAAGSLLTELDITDSDRIQVLRVKSIVGMVSGFLATYIGQVIYQENKQGFRVYCIVLAVLASCGFYAFYQLLRKSTVYQRSRKKSKLKQTANTTISLRELATEFWQLKNFRSWLGMEMCLETQCSFNRSYFRLFVTEFLSDHLSANQRSLFVSVAPIIKQCVKFIAFSFIDQLGIYEVYRLSFIVKIVGALICYSFGVKCWATIGIFLTLNFIVSELPSGGFTIAMSNMNKELLLVRLKNGRGHVPSSSGMFMGINALFCKPMDSTLPILAAKRLEYAGFNKEKDDVLVKNSPEITQAFFELLVFPPLILCTVQLFSWSKYTLHRNDLQKVEEELHDIQEENCNLMEAKKQIT